MRGQMQMSISIQGTGSGFESANFSRESHIVQESGVKIIQNYRWASSWPLRIDDYRYRDCRTLLQDFAQGEKG